MLDQYCHVGSIWVYGPTSKSMMLPPHRPASKLVSQKQHVSTCALSSAYIRGSDGQTQVKRNTTIASLDNLHTHTFLLLASVFFLFLTSTDSGKDARLTGTGTGSMRLINIDAFLRRESLIHSGKQVDRRTKVLEFRDDEATEYAILSH